MAGSGGPWGGGGKGPDDNEDRPKNGPKAGNGGNRPVGGPSVPEIDRLVKKGQEQLRVLMGGKSSGGGSGGGFGGPGPDGGIGRYLNRQTVALAVIAIVAVWAFLSFYTVKPEERAVELLFGKYYRVTDEGLHFAPWPVVSAEVINTSGQNTTEIGTGQMGESDNGLMLTGDQNIVDIEFEVVWNISDPTKYLFNLKEPEDTIRAVAESAVRDISARSQLMPILNKDRGTIETQLLTEVQATLDSYASGINVVRVNLLKSDAPAEVIDAFRAVQAAQQERDQLQKVADAYSNKVTAAARGQASQTAQEAQAYSAQVVNQAQGDAARFLSIYSEYVKAPVVTRQRLYLETMERVLGSANKVIMDAPNGSSVLPYLPLSGLTTLPPLAPSDTSTGAGGSN
jgi:membrane protease subunit HflK